MRERLVKLFKELLDIFDKFLKLLIAFIAAKIIDTGANSLFKERHQLMMSLVLIIVLYYLTLVVGTILLQLYDDNRHLPVFLTFTIILLGSPASVLALTIISPTISFITKVLWVCIFTLLAYCYYHQEVNELMRSVPQGIKNWIERARRTISIH